MIITGKKFQVYSDSNPIIGMVQANVSDYPLKTSGIKMILLRKDMSYFIKKQKDVFGGDVPGGAKHNH